MSSDEKSEYLYHHHAETLCFLLFVRALCQYTFKLLNPISTLFHIRTEFDLATT